MAKRSCFPHFAAGLVVKGFGRGSKELGIPTANFPDEVVSSLPSSMGTGIYYGLARVVDGPVHKMVMSVGWNPYYHNTKKSMETHILHEFSEDFYGSWLRVVVLGYIRPEQNFESLDLLISAIKGDISDAMIHLSSGCFDQYYDHPFMSCPVETIVQNPSIVGAYNSAVHAVQAVDSKIQDAKSPEEEEEEADEKITSPLNGHLTNGHRS